MINGSDRFELSPVKIINLLKILKPTTHKASANQTVTEFETENTRRTDAVMEKSSREIIIALQNDINSCKTNKRNLKNSGNIYPRSLESSYILAARHRTVSHLNQHDDIDGRADGFVTL